MVFSFNLKEFLDFCKKTITEAEHVIAEYQSVEKEKSEEILVNFFASDEGKEIEQILSKYNEKNLVDRLNVWDVNYVGVSLPERSDTIEQCMKVISNSDFVSTVRPRFGDSNNIEIKTRYQVLNEPSALQAAVKNVLKVHKTLVDAYACGGITVQMSDDDFLTVKSCESETNRLRGRIIDIKNS